MLFREIIKIKRPTNEHQVSSDPKSQLTFEEANVLHYAAGYVCHKLYKRLELSSNPQILIMDLCGEDDTSDDSSKAENWTSMIYCCMSVKACTLEEDASTQDHRCVQAEAAQ